MNGVKTILKKARKLIEKHGWCRGFMKNDNGHFCSIGAINEVSDSSSPENADAKAKLYSLVCNRYSSVFNWNDTKYQKKERVLKVFDMAIASC